MTNKLPAPLSSTRLTADVDHGQVGQLRDAAAIRGPISSYFFQVSRRATERALRADAATARAFEDAANAHVGAIGALINLRNRVDDYQARDELADEFYALARARAFSEIDQERARLGQRTAEARREQLTAKHGLEATRRNRDRNFALGDARKDARLAEVLDVLPQTPAAEPTAVDPLTDLKRALARAEAMRVEQTADGKDTTRVNEAIEAARKALRTAGIEG